MRVISNSEVSAYLTCERKHYYSFILDLAPKVLSQSLARGLLGHEILASYYEAISAGSSEATARKIAINIGEIQMLEAETDLTMIADLINLCKRYFDRHVRDLDSWEILGVEKSFTVPITDDYAYGMRLDLLVKIAAGQFLGEEVVIDHKFVYNFWNQDKVNLNSQIPKYIATLRHHGYNVQRGMFNQIRWRDRKSAPYSDEEKFNRYPFRPAPQKIRRVFEEQIRAAERIIERYEDDPVRVGKQSLRVLNPVICDSCPFKFICDTDLNGDDTTLMMQTEFTTNQYNATYQDMVFNDELA